MSDLAAVADEAGLRFGSDQEPGIRRVGGRRVRYVDDRTGHAPDDVELARIASLAIPPAWTDVWIAADDTSHLQATGRDAKGRKQYRYHPAFTASTSAHKFGELAAFGASLGRLRRRVRRDLAAPCDEHDQVVAVVVRLLDLTSVRVGNEEYARANETFGLTTLRNDHAHVRGNRVELTFTGKHRRSFEVAVENTTLARIVRHCQHLPGQALFEYRTTAGTVRVIGSADVNQYLAAHARPGTTAKTFRTWNATVAAATRFAALALEGSPPTKRSMNAVIDEVADELGNTRAVCRASYIHPAVTGGFLDGSLARSWRRAPSASPTGLSTDERRTLRLLRADRRRTAAEAGVPA